MNRAPLPAPVPLPRRLAAEFLGSAFLAAIVIGSGIAAQRLSPSDTGLQLLENSAGCVTGAVAANLMFAGAAVSISVKHRATGAHALSEAIATAGLLLVIFALARSGRAASAPAAVGAYIGAAYWFTSSTSFANPAITVGRMLSDSFAGIAPSSGPVFIAAQIGGGIAGVVLIRLLYPALTQAQAADAVVPHEAGQPRDGQVARASSGRADIS